MRIVVVSSFFYPALEYGGPPRSLYEIFSRLVARGHDVSVFTTDVLDATQRYKPSADPEEIGGIVVHRFPNVSNWLAHRHLVFLAPAMRAALQAQMAEFDLAFFHCFYNPQNIWGCAAARTSGVPFIIKPAGSLPPNNSPWRSLPKYLFRALWGQGMTDGAARFVAVSSGERAEQIAWGVTPEKIEVINNGIDFSEVNSYGEQGCFRAKWGIPPDRPMVLTVGGLTPRKGGDLLLKAFAQQDRDAVVVFAGPDYAGYGQHLRGMAESLGVSDRTIFTGMLKREEVLQADRDADIFVLASRHEGHPNALIEACAMGNSVIASEACNTPEITKWDAGEVIPNDDAAALAEALRRLLGSEELRRKQAHRSQEMVRGLFTWEKIVEKYEKCFAEVAGTADYVGGSVSRASVAEPAW
ncbi:MAG: glycosyltransferase family 4 protein [candidate division WS1 bacterium]|jgi:glycosyltransferase involved in cell wall biosynthesis|nr:glycosyltransferase family 4 protein [candidate division WS1 bacterium]